jgi:hypothetical protein
VVENRAFAEKRFSTRGAAAAVLAKPAEARKISLTYRSNRSNIYKRLRRIIRRNALFLFRPSVWAKVLK